MTTGNDGPAAISARGLTKRFGKRVALHALDLEIPQGSSLGLLGPAGSGKSTVVRLVAGLARPSGGSVSVAGAPGHGRGGGLAARRSIGVVPQELGLPGWMTGRELLAFMAVLSGVLEADRPSRIDDVATRLGLAEVLDRRIGELAAPLRGRLGLAQALVAEPAILVLDEPFHWLDPEARVEVRGILASLRGRSTVLLAAHRLADVEGLCDRVAVLDGGRVRFVGEAAQFLAAFAPPAYEIELAAPGGLAVEGLVARLRTEPWVRQASVVGTSLRVEALDDARAARELLPAVVGTGIAVAAVRRARPSLEAILAALPPAAAPGRDEGVAA